MIHAVRRAAAAAGHEVGHQGLLRPLRQAVVQPVGCHQGPDLPGRLRPGHAQVHQRVDDPAGDDHDAAAEPVRQRPARHAEDDLRHVQRHPQPDDGQQAQAEPRLGVQQQEQVAAVAQGEDRHRADEEVEPQAQAGRRGGRCAVGPGRRGSRADLPDLAHQGRQRRQAGNQRDGEQPTQGGHLRRGGRCARLTPQAVAQEEVEDPHGRHRAQHRPGVVHGAVEAKGQPADVGADRIADQGVAGRGADALADAVGEPQGDDVPTALRQGVQRAAGDRQAVADHGQYLPLAEGVADPPGEDLQQAGGGLADAVHEPDVQSGPGGADSRQAGQEDGQQGVDHLAGGVVEEAHQAHHQDVAADSPMPRCGPFGRALEVLRHSSAPAASGRSPDGWAIPRQAGRPARARPSAARHAGG